MRVAHVEMGRHLYGGARQVAYLLDVAAKKPGEHLLICQPGAEIGRAVAPHGIEVVELPLHGDVDIGFAWRLARRLRGRKVDLLHVHSRRGDLPAILGGRLAGVPVVFSRRVDNPPNWADRALKFPLCARIVTISHGILRVLTEAGVDPARLVCIPSAVDIERYRPEGGGDLRAELGIAAETTLIGVVAQLIPRKGHGVLFDALKRLDAAQKDMAVLVFGQGPLATELQEAVRALGLEGVVRFAGFRKDMERVLPSLDILVHPAFMEGLGVSLLEAAACGVPIIASRAGGIPEIVRDGENGYLIEPGDSAALAERLARLLADPDLRRELGRAGREIVLRDFSIPRMAAGNLGVYESLLAG